MEIFREKFISKWTNRSAGKLANQRRLVFFHKKSTIIMIFINMYIFNEDHATKLLSDEAAGLEQPTELAGLLCCVAVPPP